MPLSSSRYKQFLNTLRGERIDQPDFQYASETSQVAVAAQIGDGFIVGRDGADFVQSRKYVIHGFLTSNPATTQLSVNAGSALMSMIDNGVVINGVMQTGGVTTKTLDIATYPDGTYGVYVRVEMRESDYTNRPFWNADAVTPVEYQRIIPTRVTENWSVVVELVSPGEEWMKIYDVAKSGSALTLTDRRDFYFEGRVDNTYDPEDEWGSSDDHSSARSVFGVFGLRRFVRAVQTQIKGIIGANWWTLVNGTTYKSLLDLTSDKLERDGSNEISGTILPDANITHELGGPTDRFLTIFAQDYLSTGTITGLDEDLSGDLTVGGSATVTGAVTGTGIVSSATYLGGPSVLLTGAAPSPLTGADKGRIYEDTQVNVWGHVVTDGLGGFTTQDGVGYTASFSGLDIRCTFDNAYATSLDYAATVTVNSGGGATRYAALISARASTYVQFQVVNLGTTIIDTTVTAVSIDFHVVGRY